MMRFELIDVAPCVVWTGVLRDRVEGQSEVPWILSRYPTNAPSSLLPTLKLRLVKCSPSYGIQTEFVWQAYPVVGWHVLDAIKALGTSTEAPLKPEISPGGTKIHQGTIGTLFFLSYLAYASPTQIAVPPCMSRTHGVVPQHAPSKHAPSTCCIFVY
jgi:hypothetical protein